MVNAGIKFIDSSLDFLNNNGCLENRSTFFLHLLC
jgi:hypothetical protein